MNLPRGIRNNNPGNIRWGSDWQGLISEEERTDKSFCQFQDPVYGLRAMVKIIFTYQEKYGLNTIESILHRYAPPNENNTQGYIMRVSEAIGALPKQPLKLTDGTLKELMRAITAVENGQNYFYYYKTDQLEKAIQLAK